MEKRIITAARTSARRCRWFTFLLLGLYQGSEGGFQIPGAQQSLVVARGSPPGVWAPPSILGFSLWASFYLARFWLSLWSPMNSVTLGKFPNTLNLCFLICKNGVDNPPAVLTGQDSVCLKQALAGPCPRGAPGSGSEVLLPRLCARMPGPPPWASALRCQAGGNLWQGWQQPHAHGLVLGPGSVLCIGPIHLLRRSGHQHPSYGRGN